MLWRLCNRAIIFLFIGILRLSRRYSFVLVAEYGHVIMSLLSTCMSCRWRSSIFGMESLIRVAFIPGSKSQRAPRVGRLAGELVWLVNMTKSGIETSCCFFLCSRSLFVEKWRLVAWLIRGQIISRPEHYHCRSLSTL